MNPKSARESETLVERGIPKGAWSFDRSTGVEEHFRCTGKWTLHWIQFHTVVQLQQRALWMGVPVICMAGEGMVGRLSAAVLSGAGLEAAIASTIDGYITRAKKIASMGNRSDQQRQEIRNHLLKSHLMDSKGLASSMEKLYRSCWQSWLSTRS